MTRTDRYRGWAALLAALLFLVFLILGCGGREERQRTSGQTEGRSTGALGRGADDLVCESSWKAVPSAGKIQKPRAIAAIAENDIWVVGSTESDAGTIATGAEHWDGSSWSTFRPPNDATEDNALNGVDAVGGNDVWAVGYSEHDDRYETLVEHWDGTRWRAVKSPNAATSQFNTLIDVDALSSTNAWAAGSHRTATSRKTLIQRWDGTSWRIVSSPNPATLSNSLLGLAAVDSNDIWAVGWKSSGDGLRSLVLHYDGTRWTEVAVPSVGTGDNVLTGISAVSDNDVWATGYYVDGTEYKTLTLHYNGRTWSRAPSLNGGDGTNILMGIDAYSPTNAWAVGFEYRAALQHYVASTQHWDGSTWTALPSAISREANLEMKDSEMYAVAKAPNTSRVWAVGQPADVETSCSRSGDLTATTTPAQEETDTPTGDSTQAPEQPRSASSTESSISSPAAAPTPGGIPVRAVDKAADAGIAENTRTYGAIIADFNNNGKPDIFLGRHGGVPRLYENVGDGHFKETNKASFVKSDRHGCDAADVNGDRLKDIFCSTGAHHGTSAKRNELYLQRPDHTFAERAGQHGVFDPFGRGRLGEFIDANGDTYPDLFLANEANRGDAMPSPNRLLINRGGDTYRYAPEYGLERETDLHESTASVGDLDKDGWEDLILVTPSGLHVYHNDQGKGFTDVTASVGLGQSPNVRRGQRPNDVTIADVNGDNWPDVIKVATRKLRVLLNTNGTFSRVVSTPLEYGFSVATGDVNGDNRPDIYVMRGKEGGDNAKGANARDQVYLNDGSGTSFTQMSSIPSTSEGVADFVAPIDYDENGLTDFLVLNGGGTSGGPVQLIAFFRAP